MKTLMKRILAVSLTLVSLFSVLTVNANAANLSFRDVKQSNWFYKEVMEMTASGLFKGTTEPVNGVGTFDPQGTMTIEQFMTVLARAFYPDEYNNFDYSTLTTEDLAPTKSGYKRASYGVAAQKVLNRHGIGSYMGNMIVRTTVASSNQSISRSWAAMLMIQTLEAQNTEWGREAKNFRFSYKSDFGVDRLWKAMEDGYKRVYGTNFRSDVASEIYDLLTGYSACQGEKAVSWTYYAYALGLLTGKSGGWDAATGTWTPVDLDWNGTLTRAEGATMIYRLLDPSRRIPHPEMAAVGIFTENCVANSNYVSFDTSWGEARKFWYGLNVLREMCGKQALVWDSSLTKANCRKAMIDDASYGTDSPTAMAKLRSIAICCLETSPFMSSSYTRINVEYKPGASVDGLTWWGGYLS